MTSGEHVPLTPGWSLWPTAAVRSAGMPFGLLERFAVPELLELPPGEERNTALRRAAAEAAAAVAGDETIREALVWQNPDVIDTWLGDYAARLAHGDTRLSNRAYRETVIARYAQRYCAKNESIGFFGPVAWARFAPGEQGLRQDGSGAIRRRTVFFETWAIAALADAWRRDERLFPHLPVRLDPATTFADGRLWRPRRAPAGCPPETARVLALVDGSRTCGELPGPVLRELEDQGVVRTGFRVPFGDRPEAVLRQQVERLPDGPVRTDLLARLDDLDEAREGVQRAQGPAEVRAALGELSRRLVKAGCAAASRRTGYARTAAYLDCRRDTDVRIGSDLLDALRAPLGLLLDSARWLSAEVGDAVAEGLAERYHALAARRGEVTLSDLQFAASDLLAPDGPAATAVLADFQLRWAELLPPEEGELRLRTAGLRQLAAALFPPATPRWSAARQHSPDLLLARSPGGGFRWVLGELHVALNTLESRVFRTQCDDPDELVRLTAADHAGRVVPLYPPEAPEATARTYPPLALDPPGHYRYWSYAGDEGHQDGVTPVPGTAVLVHERDGELIGRTREGWSAPVLEFFGEFLTATVVNLFRLRARRPHLGRVLLDDVVVCRESWSCPLDAVPVPPAGRKIADRGYEDVRAWAAEHGMPRHVFVRTPLEAKPFYVDFRAPLLVGNLVRAVRRALAAGHADGTVDVVEMLPRPEELWLTDAEGRCHTAELRVVAVDEEK
ncbi:lantibiotic dehydratase [Amycolatopsis sacchari]|uniref:lantibiotic dehydratase n=1 Tax=Amycolatopsis sacchari TaxID=115433 RepID=UPI003D75BFEF